MPFLKQLGFPYFAGKIRKLDKEHDTTREKYGKGIREENTSFPLSGYHVEFRRLTTRIHQE